MPLRRRACSGCSLPHHFTESNVSASLAPHGVYQRVRNAGYDHRPHGRQDLLPRLDNGAQTAVGGAWSSHTSREVLQPFSIRPTSRSCLGTTPSRLPRTSPSTLISRSSTRRYFELQSVEDQASPESYNWQRRRQRNARSQAALDLQLKTIPKEDKATKHITKSACNAASRVEGPL